MAGAVQGGSWTVTLFELHAPGASLSAGFATWMRARQAVGSAAWKSPRGCIGEVETMKKNVAVCLLSFLFSMNICSGCLQHVDRPLYRIESCLSEKLGAREVAEQALEVERRLRSRAHAAFKA
ncbi:hypothetical protein [Solidesulfovibrio sp.]|uniref:hypothetical protein n=1 Tax=Solidesulfovibrio sp. TaxID=2910990 RepID=UPI002B213362|nr:hypothetical protein [Solidesulfovibrio sp.]MEA5088008.1 hypothetical protein [Solidesulfovibrio sp.]